ncbi:MAG: TIGR01548 family HAD-type hydrolase [Planctomycetota bacterium]|nr:TIGR01548 family HAD-type hydrolase [Planctomycetota bacterium]
MSAANSFQPNDGVARTAAYSVPRAPTPIDLRLDGNEGMQPPPELLRDLAASDPELLRRYPDPKPAEKLLADRLGISADEILITAGADDALDRICRISLGPGRSLILPEPSFEMLSLYPAILGAEIESIAWPQGPFPLDGVLAAITPSTGAIAIVSPNNPTGACATAEDLQAITKTAPHALIIIDHAYIEYGGEDLTGLALQLPNVVVTRTLSKAYGLAGLRFGYAIARAEVIGWLRAASSPYSVSSPSLSIACARLLRDDDDVHDHILQIHKERESLLSLLADLGTEPLPSQANFVMTRCENSLWLRDGMAGLGIGVRAFPDRDNLDDAVRITCPGNDEDFERLRHGLSTTLKPQALLLDMDGVLADVSGSYRRAIVETAAAFDVDLNREDIQLAKASGSANNDWELTHRLIAERGVSASIEAVTEKFEELYQGTGERAGLHTTERLLVPAETLESLASKVTLGVVTGRPRTDMQRFLDDNHLGDVISTTICMEDAPAKPDPAGVRLALARLGVDRAWMIGDTPDDIRAARNAGVIPIGVIAPGDPAPSVTDSLFGAGAARVLENISQIEEFLR